MPALPRLSRLALPGVLALLTLAPSVAIAAPDDATRKEAERLFVEARAALEKGRREEACAGFRKSLALVEVANTVFNVARCDEQDGRLASAMRGWQRGLALVPPGDERVTAAHARVAELEPKVPKVTVKLTAGAPAGTRVLVDGVALTEAELASPLRLDPGEHTVVVEAPGRQPREVPLKLAEGAREEVAVAPGPEQPANGGVGPPPPPPPKVIPEEGDTRRTLGFVIGGVGLAGLAAAGITGGLLLARDAEIKDACPEPGWCSPEGMEKIDGSKPLMVVNAIAWGVGAVGLGVGAVLVLTSGGGGGEGGGGEARAQAAIAPAVLPGGGGMTVVGRF